MGPGAGSFRTEVIVTQVLLFLLHKLLPLCDTLLVMENEDKSKH